MARLMVKYGKSKKNKPFHPTLQIRNTAYSRNQWQQMHFREGLMVGSDPVSHSDVRSQVEYYLSELKRMGYTDVTENYDNKTGH